MYNKTGSKQPAAPPLAASSGGGGERDTHRHAQSQLESASPKNACDRMTSVSERSHGISLHRSSGQGSGPWPRKKKAPQVVRRPVSDRATSVTVANKDMGISPIVASHYNMDPTLRDDSQATLVTSCTDLVSTASEITHGYNSDPHNLSALSESTNCSECWPMTL
ncbi:unnamed protein product [Dicrocoelium dendriticum]|nr:unnamed protein product [Dicrocoelium dendriticum]